MKRGEFKIEYPPGASVAIIRVTGDRKNCERAHLRIVFPGGDFEVVRATDDDDPDYWVHIRVDRPDDGSFLPGETVAGQFVAARLDQRDKNSCDSDLGDFSSPSLYHVALRVRRAQKDR
jgi:hypothetical protein